MKADNYNRIALTVIASCLLILVLQSTPGAAKLFASTPLTCKGDLTAKHFGGTEGLIGGYELKITCQ